MLVACICLTADRPEFTAKAVDSFLRQDYANRRLLVFDTSKERPAEKFENPKIFHWYEERRPTDTIGSLRNRANSFADMLWNPELLAHWDSDDISAPGRLTDQVERLKTSGKAATGYNTIVFTDGVKRWRYQGVEQFALGTSLMYRIEWWRDHKFENLAIGEDNTAVEQMSKAGQLVTALDRDLMEAWVHPGNSSPKVPHDNWELLA